MKRDGKRSFFAELTPLATAIENLPPAKLLESTHDNRAADIAAQRKRARKAAFRMKQEKHNV